VSDGDADFPRGCGAPPKSSVSVCIFLSSRDGPMVGLGSDDDDVSVDMG